MDRASRWWRKNRHKAAYRAPLWLERTGYFIYYSQPLPDMIEIAAIWHASRRKRPKF